MFIRMCKEIVSIWFVLWGHGGTVFNADLYKTAAGLKRGITSKESKDVLVVRLGKIEFRETGPFEKIYWTTREDFLSQYKYL